MMRKIIKIFKRLLVSVTNSRRIRGKGNKVHMSFSTWMRNSHIHIKGNNNDISVSPSAMIKGVRFFVEGNNNTIQIGDYVELQDGCVFWIENNGCAITIGEKTTLGAVHLAVTEDGSSISIGEDCMFSSDIDVRTGDSHSIIDLQTNKRINPAISIVVGNHVWCGAHVSILKGVNIPNDTIIATHSVVTKCGNIKNTIIGGVPAKVIKENVTWKRDRI